jgi:hypothetical protein
LLALTQALSLCGGLEAAVGLLVGVDHAAADNNNADVSVSTCLV